MADGTTSSEFEELERKDAERRALTAEMASLQTSLQFGRDIGDWKIAKCYEAKLQDKEMPYDLDELMTARQKARDRINELQEKIDRLDA